MAVVKEDFGDLRSRDGKLRGSRFRSFRVSSSQPRSFGDGTEIRGQPGCLVSVQQINNNFPAFKVGPCQLQRKPREVKSAQVSLSIRNLALSLGNVRFKRRDTLESNKRTERKANDIKYEDNDLDDYSNIDDLKVNLTGCVDNGSSGEQKSLESSFGSTEVGESLRSKATARGGKKKRVKTGRKTKIRRKSSRKEVRKNKVPKLEKLKLSPRRGEAKLSSGQNLGSNLLKIRNAYSGASLIARQSKSLPEIDTKSTVSGIKSPNTLCDPQDTATMNSVFANGMRSPARCTKVYLSEKQSRTIMGIPAVPPGTPGLDFQKEVEWVPSLSDIKSQRSITLKLSKIVAKQSQKESKQKLAKEQKMQEIERKRVKELQTKIKERQRAEIYALNKILTEVENEQFERLKRERGLPV